ncbi:Maltodextrin-binding protein MdxE precursor [compost metagenome]
MTRKFSLLMVALLSLSLLLSACGSSDNTTKDSGSSSKGTNETASTDTGSGGKVNLSFWTLFDGGDGDNMQALVDKFNQEHPNIQVKNTKLVWAEYYTKLITAVGAGNGPDIGISHISRLPDLINQGVATELDDSAKEAGVDWSTFNQNILDASVYDSKHYAVPIDTHPFIMYYNKALLKTAGLLGEDGKPMMEQSADGFIKFLTALKEKLPKGKYPFALSNTNDDPFRLWWALYSQQGGNDVVSDDLKSPDIDTAKATKAADYIKDLYHKYNFIKLNDPDFYKTFQSGNAAIMMTGVWATGTWESTKGLDFGAMPIPKIYDQEATWGDAHTIILPTTTNEDPEKRKAALIFANWIADNGQIWAKAGHIPAKPAVFDKPEFKEMPYRSDYVSVASTVKFPKHSDKNWQIRDNAMFKYLNEIWSNKMSSTDAFSKIQTEITKILSE